MNPDQFQATLPFALDTFQLDAIDHIAAGEHVLVAAPTGSGKTLVAEFALQRAHATGGRSFYTTPLKALSNQKFGDLCSLFGKQSVGLLTGDVSVNPDAQIVVMTTEVLRNMLYANAGMVADLSCVIFDEIHFIGDEARGPVWEEVLIHLPRTTQLVGLSATIANAKAVRDWIASVHGATHLIHSSHRPVPLIFDYAIGVRRGSMIRSPMFRGTRVNPELRRDLDRLRASRRARPPSRIAILEDLAEARELPAIAFVFSRQGCDDAVTQCIQEDFQLTSQEASDRAIEHFELAIRSLSPHDQMALRLDMVREGFRRGIAAHHAGQVPPLKEAIERAFADGAIRLVFATETLALGINMPARTVILERLSRYTGSGHRRLSANELIQIAGRAGRRGLDDSGRVVVAHSPWVEPEAVIELARAKPHAINSAFRPTYHMAANLVRNWPRDRAIALLERSFAAFQTPSRPLVDEFDRVLRTLTVLGFLNGWELTPTGALLADTTANRDALIVLSVPVLSSVTDPATFAGLVSGLVYEGRGESAEEIDAAHRHCLPHATLLTELAIMMNAVESKHRVPNTPVPNFAFAPSVQRWVTGDDLSSILERSFESGGDVVRHLRQVMDVLSQFRKLMPARRAVVDSTRQSIDRGIVAASYAIGA